MCPINVLPRALAHDILRPILIGGAARTFASERRYHHKLIVEVAREDPQLWVMGTGKVVKLSIATYLVIPLGLFPSIEPHECAFSFQATETVRWVQ